jgi:uncharacterized protein YqgV (UPF0045/DUF77 family)
MRGAAAVGRLHRLERPLVETGEGVMPVVSAQVSVYPLRSEHVSAIVNDTVESLERRGLDTRPGSMSTVVVGADDEVFAALAAAFRSAAERGEVVMVVTVSTACPR